jgi:hypothetical protein
LSAGGQGLERVLGVRDLVFLNVSAILGFRWLSTQHAHQPEE